MRSMTSISDTYCFFILDIGGQRLAKDREGNDEGDRWGLWKVVTLSDCPYNRQIFTSMTASYRSPSFNSPPTTILSLCAQGTFRLLDFEWAFAVATKHSLLAHTDCLVHLKLTLAARTTEQRRVVHLELSMSEFNQFFREMEKIANTLTIIN